MLSALPDESLLFVAGPIGAFSARSLTDGSAVWSEPLAAQTPAIFSDHLALVAAAGLMRAVTPSSGSDRWPFGIATGPAPPCARAGWVIVPSTTGVGAYRAGDGSVVWQRALGGYVAAAPVIDGNRVFIALSDGRLAALDVSTGDVVWNQRIVSTPTGLFAGNGLVYFGASNGRLYAHDEATGIYKWAYPIGSDPVDAPAADGSRVYIAARDNVVWALDAVTGNMRWHVPLPARPVGRTWRDGNDLVVALLTGEIDMIDVKTGKGSGTIPAPPVATIGIFDFPARLQSAISAGDGRLLRLTLDRDQRHSTLALFTRATPPETEKPKEQ